MSKRNCLVSSISALALLLALPLTPLLAASYQLEQGEMAGYLLVPNNRVPETYNAGFSMYVAAWPLLAEYPGNRFQTGLFGTWMHAQYDDPKPEGKLYSDIEGGLGWWRDTRFATETPKFIMGGVALNFVAWANGPGAGKGRDWDRPQGKYAVAQLTPWLLWPPDGLNLQQGACGQLFGYGYHPLPLTDPQTTTAGKDVPTGNHCWTLFLNAANFRGPVTFFTPYFFSRPTVDDPNLAGLFLDTRPSGPNRALQMETQYVPACLATSDQGPAYARIAPTSFPRTNQGDSPVVHQVTAYDKSALWDRVEAWFQGDAPARPALDPAGSIVHTFPGRGGATWRIYTPGTPREQRVPIAWDSFARPAALDPATFGYRWNEDLVTEQNTDSCPLVTLPEYYRLDQDDNGKSRWVPVAAADVPPETGLADVRFSPPHQEPSEPYVTPEDADGCWKKPGPVAGPFEARPGDGSVVTYYWYRFADQPALLNADLTDAERERLQQRVEMLHRHWTKDQQYLRPPQRGTLAAIDPALILTPPEGLEIGYVPIATRQAPGEPALFDGRSLDRWHSSTTQEDIARCWQIEDGQLISIPRSERPEGAHASLLTNQTFSDFELSFEFKLDTPTPETAVNSGVKYFVYPDTELGLEYQIYATTADISALHATADLYDLLPAHDAALKPFDQWNTARIVSRGATCEHWLNGARVLTYERGGPAFRAAVAQSKFKNRPQFGELPAGHIMLQDHGGGVRFRNITIKPL